MRHHSSAVDLNYTNPLLVYPRVEESEDLRLRSRTQAYQRTSDSRDGQSRERQSRERWDKNESFERNRLTTVSNERQYQMTHNHDLNHDLPDYKENEPLRHIERTSDKGAIKYSSPMLPEHKALKEFEQPDPVEEYRMLREKREREQRSHSSGGVNVSTRSAQYMKAYNTNGQLDSNRHIPTKSRERSAFDSRGGDPATEYAYETRKVMDYPRQPRWTKNPRSPSGSPLRNRQNMPKGSNSPRSDNKSFERKASVPENERRPELLGSKKDQKSIKQLKQEQE